MRQEYTLWSPHNTFLTLVAYQQKRAQLPLKRVTYDVHAKTFINSIASEREDQNEKLHENKRMHVTYGSFVMTSVIPDFYVQWTI